MFESKSDAVAQALIAMKDEIKKLRTELYTLKTDLSALDDRVRKLERPSDFDLPILRGGDEQKLDRIIALLEELVELEKKRAERSSNATVALPTEVLLELLKK